MNRPIKLRRKRGTSAKQEAIEVAEYESVIEAIEEAENKVSDVDEKMSIRFQMLNHYEEGNDPPIKPTLLWKRASEIHLVTPEEYATDDTKLDERGRIIKPKLDRRGRRIRPAPGTVSVYAFSDPRARRIKIGISDVPRRRLSDFNIPGMSIVWEFECLNRDRARVIEGALHSTFDENRFRGSEWFAMSETFNHFTAAVECQLAAEAEVDRAAR